MTGRSLTVCTTPGCPALTPDARCPACKRTAELARGSAASRGYDSRWRSRRARFLRRCSTCQHPDCDQPATDVDHTPERIVLVRRGVADPDADEYLTALCHRCHSRKTARETGFGG